MAGTYKVRTMCQVLNKNYATCVAYYSTVLYYGIVRKLPSTYDQPNTTKKIIGKVSNKNKWSEQIFFFLHQK